MIQCHFLDYKTYPGPKKRTLEAWTQNNDNKNQAGSQNNASVQVSNSLSRKGGKALSSAGDIIRRELPEPPVMPPPDYNETMASREKVF